MNYRDMNYPLLSSMNLTSWLKQNNLNPQITSLPAVLATILATLQMIVPDNIHCQSNQQVKKWRR